MSISITFFNKAVLSSYDFNFSNIMTLGQMVFSLVFLVGLKSVRQISYPDWSNATALQALPLAVCFMLMVLSGLAALRLLNVPMFSALRRFTTLITMLSERMLQGTRHSTGTVASMFLMVLGAVIAGIFDLTFDFTGYVLVAINCFVTAGYLIYINRVTEQTKINSYGLMFYCNTLSLPLVIAVAVVTGEAAAVRSYPFLFDLGFIVCFLMQSVQAFLLNYTIFLCTSLNSALTTSVTGQMKNILVTAIGLFIFGDVVFDALNLFGLFLGVVGSVWYTLDRYWDSLEKEARRKAEKERELRSERGSGAAV